MYLSFKELHSQLYQPADDVLGLVSVRFNLLRKQLVVTHGFLQRVRRAHTTHALDNTT